MLRFTDTEQHYPPAQPPLTRAHNFAEIFTGFAPPEAAEQSSRCSQCGIPFCQIHCPLQNNIPDWLKLTAEGRLREAYAISSATNTFPEICGRICPQDRLCEGNCVIEKDFGAVTIGSVEKFITENAFAEGWVEPIRVTRETGFSIGIIGAGPAGLSAADMLRRQGHSVIVYDRYDRVGGLMIYGIPNFKLEKEVVQRRDKLLREGGIEFTLGHDVGENFAELRARHDAVLIATGVYKPREGNVPAVSSMGEAIGGVIPALPYLTASNRTGLGDAVPGFVSGMYNAAGKRVVVIGGGDTAMDCLRTALRQGAKSVTCLYRRDRANMPGSRKEVRHAEEEGVVFEWLAAPLVYKGHPHVERIQVQRMQLLEKDRSGRQGIAPSPGETHWLEADMVIQALGFDAEDLSALWNTPELALSPNGTLAVNGQLMTSLPGVFAAGDIVRGASLVVWAIRDGRDAAYAIDQYLSTQAKVAA